MNNSIAKRHLISNVLVSLTDSETFRRILILGLIILIGAVIGLIVLRLSLPQVLALIIGTTFMAFSIQRIELPFYLCVFLLVMLVESGRAPGDSIFRYVRDINYHGIPSLLEVSIGILILTFVIRLFLQRDKLFVSPLNFPMIIFLVLLGISLFVGLQNGAERETLKNDFKKFLVPVLFFICSVNILSSRKKIKFLMLFLFGVAFIKSCLGNIFYLKGLGFPYGGHAMIFGEASDHFIFVTLIVVFISQIIHRRVSGGKLILLLFSVSPMLFTVIFSHRRGAWLGLLVSLGLFFLIVRGSRKFKMITVSACAALILAILISFSNLVGNLPSAGFLKNRFLSTFDSEQGSNVSHYLEFVVTFEDTMKHPILGLGLGSTHRRISEHSTIPTHTVHNAFLMLWMKMGIFALILFLWCLIRYIIFGIRAANSPEEFSLKSLQVGLFSSFGFMIIALNVGPSWYYYRETCLMALVIAIVLNLTRLNKSKGYGFQSSETYP